MITPRTTFRGVPLVTRATDVGVVVPPEAHIKDFVHFRSLQPSYAMGQLT